MLQRGRVRYTAGTMKPRKLVKEAERIAAPYCVTDGKKFRLKDFDAGDTDGVKSKKAAQSMVEHSSLMDHDFLWREHKVMPSRGKIGIFNRSYYEEVLVVRVHPQLLKAEKLPDELVTKHIWEERYDDINAFERFLTRNGVVIRKFFLHISKEEQKKRFLERLEDSKKNWKFSMDDIKERKFWDDYQEAYEEMVQKTATKRAPWHVIPADSKWYARLVVASAKNFGELVYGSPIFFGGRVKVRLEGVLEPEFDLTASRDGLGEFTEVSARGVEDDVGPRAGENARCIGEEVGVIEGVEELGAEGQLMTLVKLKGASDASVVKPLARTDVRIAAEIPLHSDGRNDEVEGGSGLSHAGRQAIEAILIRTKDGAGGEAELRAINADGSERCGGIAQVGPIVAAVRIPVKIEATVYRFRVSGLRGEGARPTPATRDVADDAHGHVVGMTKRR